jgi:hypothetical protein
MKVVLLHNDVVEACREWLKSHYNINATGSATVSHNSVGAITIEFAAADNKVPDDKVD